MCAALYYVAAMAKTLYVTVCVMLLSIGATIVAASDGSFTEQRSVSRLNFGMTFRFKGHFDQPTSTWRHSFCINIPSHEFDEEFTYNNTEEAAVLAQCVERIGWGKEEIKTLGPKLPRAAIIGSCGRHAEIIELLMNVAKNGHAKIRTLVDDIRGLVPEMPKQGGQGGQDL